MFKKTDLVKGKKKVYKVGDKVKIVDKRNWWWNHEGKMDEYCGKVLTIKEVPDENVYIMEEAPKWAWSIDDIVGYVEEAPVTTKERDKAFEEASDCAALATACTLRLVEIAEKYGKDKNNVVDHFIHALSTAADHFDFNDFPTLEG